MNCAYRLIWNEQLNAWVVAPEIASARGKRGQVKRSAAALMLTLAIGAHAALAADLAATALPGGGQVSAGQATISSTGAAMTINQGSQRAIINWQNFDIGSQASVNFQQPNSFRRHPQPRRRPHRLAHRGPADRQRPGLPHQPQRRPLRQRRPRQCRRAGRFHPEYPRRRFPVRQLRLQRQQRKHHQPGADHCRARWLSGLHFSEHHQQRHHQRAAGNGRHGRRRTRPAQLCR